jgi:hypothetical protein
MISFKDLSWPLKVAVILAWIYGFMVGETLFIQIFMAMFGR